jgi:hypothetical protein
LSIGRIVVLGKIEIAKMGSLSFWPGRLCPCVCVCHFSLPKAPRVPAWCLASVSRKLEELDFFRTVCSPSNQFLLPSGTEPRTTHHPGPIQQPSDILTTTVSWGTMSDQVQQDHQRQSTLKITASPPLTRTDSANPSLGAPGPTAPSSPRRRTLTNQRLQLNDSHEIGLPPPAVIDLELDQFLAQANGILLALESSRDRHVELRQQQRRRRRILFASHILTLSMIVIVLNSLRTPASSSKPIHPHTRYFKAMLVCLLIYVRTIWPGVNGGGIRSGAGTTELWRTTLYLGFAFSVLVLTDGSWADSRTSDRSKSSGSRLTTVPL